MSLADDAHSRARDLDRLIEDQIPKIRLSSSNELLSELRAYMDRQDRTLGVGNNVISQLKRVPDPSGLAQINLGVPSLDRTSSAFVLRSGSRLTFGVTVRDGGRNAVLIAYRFQVQFPEWHSPNYLRFDLIPRQHEVPLREARCHLHPGTRDMRIPIPVLSPFEVLDRIFFVIEPQIRR